jgi:hypothetical protein
LRDLHPQSKTAKAGPRYHRIGADGPSAAVSLWAATTPWAAGKLLSAAPNGCSGPEADRRPVSSKAEEAQSGSSSGAPPVNPCPTKQRKHEEGVRIEGQWIGQRRERCTTEDL